MSRHRIPHPFAPPRPGGTPTEELIDRHAHLVAVGLANCRAAQALKKEITRRQLEAHDAELNVRTALLGNDDGHFDPQEHRDEDGKWTTGPDASGSKTNSPPPSSLPTNSAGLVDLPGSPHFKNSSPWTIDRNAANRTFWDLLNTPLLQDPPPRPPTPEEQKQKEELKKHLYEAMMRGDEVPTAWGPVDPFTMLQQLQPPKRTAAEGVLDAFGEFIHGFTSPIGIAALGMGALPRAAQKFIALAFAAHMVKQTPHLARELGTEFAKPEAQRDPQKIAHLITIGAGNLGFSILAVSHAFEAPDKAAAEAAGSLEKSGNTGQWSDANDAEGRAQIGILRKWAQAAGRLINFDPPEGAKQLKGSERDGYVDPTTGRVYKRTYPPGTFGLVNIGQQLERIATPYFYLRRIALMNQVFNSGIRLEGITPGDNPSIITSEPFHQALNEQSPHPSAQEVQAFMRGHGFEPLPNVENGWGRKSDGIQAYDTRPENFIKTVDGIAPIDLVLQGGSSAFPKK